MLCPQCQHENNGGKFCGECGARLELRCAACGEPNPLGNRFCQECGERFTAAPTPATPADPGPVSYTPQHLAERIISSRSALEGERKQVTVLFADLKGSMELLAGRDPEDARRILDPVLERMMEAVHRYEGTVNQVMGDGIMALFGAPLAHEDHAVRACYAALRMQESVKQYAEDVRWAEGLLIQIRVGLNSGEVVVRSIGSDLRMDYTAVGQTTHLAARMEQLAAPGAILLAPETLRLAEGYVHVRNLGPKPVKGLSAPVEVYEITGASTTRTRLQAAAARGLTRFVGRDTEIEVLRRTLERAGARQGQLVALVGEPGVGKSRLTWEFTHSHRTQTWVVLEGGSVSYGKASSYLPVIDLLRTYCRIEARDDARAIREKLTGKLLTLDPALQPALPAFLTLFDVPVDDAVWDTLDPPQRRQRTLEALKRVFLRESQQQPLLLVFEDLHWIDAETQALLDSLVESLPTLRLLLLVNYRPEYEHRWGSKSYYQQLRLDPLPAESAEELLQAVLGTDRSLVPLTGLLVERTQGNPFFLEECVRTLVEMGTLSGERGAYQLVNSVETTQVPATVQAVLAARIDRLASEDKRLLHAAAVIGKDVPYPLLQAIAELPEHELRQGLTRLQAAEFLYETSLFPDLEYTFKHALTHEVAYGSLLQDRRRTLHARIVEASERLYPDRLTEQVERLAHHAFRAEVWEKAVSYLHQAGRKVAAYSAFREAVVYFERALEALAHLPENRTRLEQAVDLHFDLVDSLAPLREFEHVLESLRKAETLAGLLDDQRRLATAFSFLTNHHWRAGDYESAVASGQRALVIAEALGDFAQQVRAKFYLGQALYTLGDYPRASQLLSWNLASLQGELLREQFGHRDVPSVTSRSFLVLCLAERGEFAEAIRPADEAIRIAEEVGQPFSLIIAAMGAGHLYLIKGDLQKAISPLERAHVLCQDWQVPLLLPWVVSALGHAYVLCGRVAEGRPLLEQAVSIRLRVRHALLLAWLGEAWLLDSRTEQARGLAKQALAVAQEYKERGYEGWALRLLGDVAAQVDPPEVAEAESHYRQSLGVAEELEMRPLAAHCHLGVGTLYQKIGRHEQAQAALATAAEMYRAMEMTFWLERAETALAQVAS